MRTMMNPGSTLTNPAEKFFRWNGKTEKVKNTSGEIEKEGGYLFFDDKDNDYETVKLPFPLTVYPLGESMSIQGGVYDGANTANNTFLSSNEFTDWSEPITVYERHIGDDRGAVIAQGEWNEISETLKAHKGKVRTNLYALCKKQSGEFMIVRFELGGGAGRAFGEFRRKCGADFYEQSFEIVGAEYKVNGSVDYAVPKFQAGAKYDEDIRNVILEYCKTINDYGNALHEKNMANANAGIIKEDTGDFSESEINQGDAPIALSQEPEIDLDGVPF